METENKVVLIVFVFAVIIFILGTILDRIYFHHNTPLEATLVQNSVEIAIFLMGVHLGMKFQEAIAE